MTLTEKDFVLEELRSRMQHLDQADNRAKSEKVYVVLEYVQSILAGKLSHQMIEAKMNEVLGVIE